MMSTMAKLPRRAVVLAAFTAAAVMLGACTDNSGPGDGGSFSASRAQADVQAMRDILESPVWDAFGFVLGGPAASRSAEGRLLGTAAASRRLITATLAGSPAEQRRVALDVVRQLTERAGGRSATAKPALEPAFLGRTFVYDPSRLAYVEAPGRTGAPVNGLRFILYAMNPVSGEPVLGSEVGYIDLIDSRISHPTGYGIRLVVVSAGKTFLDYRIDIDGDEAFSTYKIHGFAGAEGGRLNFTINLSFRATFSGLTQVSIGFNFEVPSRDFSFTAALRGVGGVSDEGTKLQIRSGDTRVTFDIVSDEETLDATVRVNGQLFARLTGNPLLPTITGAGGRSLNENELVALADLFNLTQHAYDLFLRLTAPLG